MTRPQLSDRERIDRQITEQQVQTALTDALSVMGWLWNHNPDSRRSNPGLPDIQAVSKYGWIGQFECKTQQGRLRPEQREWLDRLGLTYEAKIDQNRKLLVAVVRPSNLDSIIATLRRLR